MLKKIAIGLGVLVLLLVGIVASRPAEYRVERSTVIAAPAEIPFGLVNDYKGWRQWSPWDKLDPNQQVDYSDPSSGVGATSHWKGKDVGEGRMTHLENVPNEKLVIKLEFMEPFPSTSTVTFSFAPEGTGTKVTWQMDGVNDFMGKAFSLVMDMDAMLGKDFDEGLANLKKASEEAAAKAAADAAAKAAQEAAAAATDPAAPAAPADPAAAPVPAPPQ